VPGSGAGPVGRVAIVHDWLTTVSGAEHVLARMLEVLPQSDLFAVADFLPPSDRGFLGGRPVTSTFIQRLPFARNRYRGYLPLMPLAIESLDLSGYDLVVSSSHAVAKGVLTGPAQLHLCMCYSPIRYAWDLQHQYLRESGLDRGIRGGIARLVLHRMRLWDVRTANGVDHFIAISRFIARRIEKVYRRPSTVIYPPVDTRFFVPGGRREGFYLTASRLVPYKRIAVIVEAFRALPDRHLVVIGDGPELKRIRALAGPNVAILRRQPAEVVRDHLQRARAFVFAAEEDFGIVVVEAQACGTPVIAYGRGGNLETVRGWWPGQPPPERPTGVFFDQQTPESIVGAVRAFERASPLSTAEACRAHAEQFSAERFLREFGALVEARWQEFVGERSRSV
jgi:glycosyltransferase involved in cell wall biosynthesis